MNSPVAARTPALRAAALPWLLCQISRIWSPCRASTSCVLSVGPSSTTMIPKSRYVCAKTPSMASGG
jgi:hypothetical protein